jgi:cell division protein ZapA
MKQLEVQIMGQSYLLGCPEGGEARLLDAVERVDTAMCKIRDAGKVKARDRIAVLAALNLAFDISDRVPPAVPAAAAADGKSVPPPGEAADHESDPDLTQLLQRLDQTLADDGRLL